MPRLSLRFHNPIRGVRKSEVRDDAMAGLVLGVESVPDGLASGLLAGVNPVFGLYGYLFGLVGAACFTSSTFMAVQGTGAMAVIVDDVGLDSFGDPARALFTLSIMTGLVMILAGMLRLGIALRFVPRPVMVGFVTAVGINIALGQLDTFTGYSAEADSNRLARALILVLHFWRIDLWTTLVGALTLVLILKLRSTRLGAMGLVVAVVAGSVAAVIMNQLGADVQTVEDVAKVPRALPMITMPKFSEMFDLLIPATSLAFVGLIQGAGISTAIPNRDGTFGNPSVDFVGQGIGNISAGLFQGVPVGGSMSASSLIVQAGAKSRLAMLFAGGIMALVILALGGLVEYVAMPSLGALLIVVGIMSTKPSDVLSVGRTGLVQLTVMVTTLILTLLIPLQFAVLVGVGIAMILFVVDQSTDVTMRRVEVSDNGELRESDPPDELGPNSVVIMQMYGNVFFANTDAFSARLPTITDDSRNSVVILRARGADDLGATLIAALDQYIDQADAVDSKLMIVSDNPHMRRQLKVSGTLDKLGKGNLYASNEWLGRATRRVYTDAQQWVKEHTTKEDDHD